MEVIRPGTPHVPFPMGDASRVGEARRHAAQLAARLALDDTTAGRLALVVTELGNNLVPDYMAMGETGMSEMTDMAAMMEVPLPENTLPMMTGTGPFGPIEMGGMFTTVKIRADLSHDDFADPGAYRHPAGQVAYEWTGESLNPVRAPTSRSSGRGIPFQVRKPTDHTGH